MIPKDQISKEVERTLQSLDGVQRAKVNPFLYTRIQARMKKEQNSRWEWTFSFISRPVVAVAILIIVMAINGWSLVDGSGDMTTVSATETDNVTLPDFEREYQLITSTDNYFNENSTGE